MKSLCINDICIHVPTYFSSISSSLNAIGAIIWQDMMKPRWGHLSETRQTLIIKVIGNVHLGRIGPYLLFWRFESFVYSLC